MQGLFSGQLLIAALVTGSIYALMATGLNLIYGTMRMINVAHGDFVMMGAYLAYWSFTFWKIGPLAAAIPAIAIGAVFGIVLYRTVFISLLRSGRSAERMEANSLLVFFGISVIIQNVVAMAFTNNQRGYQYLDQIVHFGDNSVTLNKLVVLFVSLSCVIGIILFLRYTVAGLSLRALIQNRDAATIVGINAPRIYVWSFMTGFALAMLGGTLISMFDEIYPFMGFPYSVVAFIIIIIGGLGNIFGGLAGGMLFGILETFGTALTGPSYRSVLIYGVFILVLMFCPQGLFGIRGQLR